TPAAFRAGRSAERAEDESFFDRFMPELLHEDPRYQQYEGWWSSRSSGEDEGIWLLLRQMRDEVNARQGLHAVGGSGAGAPANQVGTGRAWSPARKLQTR